MTVTTRRRRDVLPIAVPVVAAAVIGFGFALDRWVIGSEIEIPPEATGKSQPAVAADSAQQSVIDKAHFDALFARGIGGLRTGNPGQAADAFEAARRLKQDVPALHANLGFARLELGQVEAAIKSFEAAIELRPSQANAYFGLAESRERQGDLEAALGAMRTFVHLSPEDDPFRSRALSAIWEWETSLSQRPPPAAAAIAPDATGAAAQGRGLYLQTAPLIRLDGGSETLARFSGKTVILNIWATWCAPCRAELPSLQRLSDRLDPERYAVVGLSTDEDPDYVREFLGEMGVRYPNYLDPKRDITFGILMIESYPQTLLIRPDGSIAETIIGARAWDRPEMIANIESTR